MNIFEKKDAVLKTICENFPVEKNCGHSFAELSALLPSPVDFTTLNGILTQFQRMGLIDNLNARPVKIWLVLRIDAIDFLQRGGFAIQEELFQTTYNKLQLEVETLQKDFPDRAERFSTIMANMAAIAAFLISAKSSF